jgi:hypothetical protein
VGLCLQSEPRRYHHDPEGRHGAKRRVKTAKTAFDYAHGNKKQKGTDVYWKLNNAQY